MSTAREKLEEFLYRHLEPSPQGEGISAHFLSAKVVGDPEKGEFESLLKEQEPENGASFTWWDGEEHSYLTIGAWLGSQHAALLVMILGTAVGLWKLHTPENMLGDLVPQELKDRMAGMGMVTVQSIAEKERPCTPP